MGIVTNGKLLAAGGLGLFIAYSQADLAMNYTEVSAKVTAVKFDCYVKASKKKLVDKKTNSLAYMDCETAKMAAQEFGYDDTDVKRRAAIKFTWVSPVDGSVHSDEHTDGLAFADYGVGKPITIYAHTSEPGKMRWN